MSQQVANVPEIPKTAAQAFLAWLGILSPLIIVLAGLYKNMDPSQIGSLAAPFLLLAREAYDYYFSKGQKPSP